MRPGITKNVNVGNSWTRLATLYDVKFTDNIKEGETVAGGIMLMILTNSAQLAFADDTPNSAGHVMNNGDSFREENPDWIRRGWLKNDASGSVAVAIITPLYNY
jgi:hypothetical protein